MPGQTQCEACPPGRFQDQVGQTSCQECPAGTFQPSFGAIDCVDCPDGSSSPVGAESCEILPIELISFTGTASGSLLELNWVTAREEDFSHFVLEMATSDSFSELVIIAGAGSTSLGSSYRYPHKAGQTGAHFFRLRQVDLDGSFALSSVVALIATEAARAKVYPNPVEDRLFIDPASSDEATVITVYSGEGRLVLRQNFSARAVVSLLTDEWKTGIYSLVVMQQGTVEHFRVVRR